MKTNSLDFDAQALREKILDLAMRGKLVKQDPNDEPAGVLLEKIKAEKAELIKEKKIKKSKPLPEITDDEKPFDIPDSWEWVRLGEVITLASGKQLTKNKMNNSFQYPVFGANGIIGYFKEYNINPNTILIGRVGSVGSINLTTNNTWATDNALIVTPICKNNLSVVWLEYLLQFSNLGNLASRTSQPVISATKVGNVIIPFPPLEEQSRIAAKIAQLFALLRKVESSTQQYAKLQTLLKEKVLDLAMRGKLVKQDPNDEPASVLLEKIKAEKEQLIKEKKIKKSKPLPPITDEEKPFDIPESWEWVRLGEVITLISGRDIAKKYHLNRKTHSSIPYITGASNIDKTGKINITEWVENPSVIVSKGTLLLSVKGTIGKIAFLNLNRAHIARQIMGIKNTHSLNGEFQKHFIENYVAELKHKAKSMIPGISRDDIILAPFPLPPLKEQQKIVKKSKDIFNLIEEL